MTDQCKPASYKQLKLIVFNKRHTPLALLPFIDHIIALTIELPEQQSEAILCRQRIIECALLHIRMINRHGPVWFSMLRDPWFMWRGKHLHRLSLKVTKKTIKMTCLGDWHSMQPIVWDYLICKDGYRHILVEFDNAWRNRFNRQISFEELSDHVLSFSSLHP